MGSTLKGNNLLLEKQILFLKRIPTPAEREVNSRRVLPLQENPFTLILFVRGILALTVLPYLFDYETGLFSLK